MPGPVSMLGGAASVPSLSWSDQSTATGSRCDRKIKPVTLRQNQTAAETLVAGVVKEPLAHVLPGRPRPYSRAVLIFWISMMWPHLGLSRNKYSNTRLTGSATKDYDRATDAHFRPDKPWGATGKSLIVLNPWMTLNHRVPGSSPGAPTKLSRT
jgi:hypothetical protein